MKYKFNSPENIAEFIKGSPKSTPVKVYINGDLKKADFNNIEWYGSKNFYILFGEYSIIKVFIEKHKPKIKFYRFENDRRNSTIPLFNSLEEDIRIEPGAIIRSNVKIEKYAVIMMGAVINIGAIIKEGALIDMNSVIGARGIVGKYSHIGAGAVIAGVLEPPSLLPCEIGDFVLVGANSVVLEGVTIGNGSVVAAGSVVTHNIPPNTVYGGSPAKFIKNVDEQTKRKTQILKELRF